VTIAAAQGIASLDPAKLVFAWEQATYTVIFDALVTYTSDGGEEIQPALAESWDVSEDLKTYTFKLRDGVRFSNGEALTADDVVANFDRYLDDKTAWFGKTRIEVIDSVKAEAEDTVVMHLSTPSRSLPEGLTAAPIVFLRDQTEEDLSNSPIGTGPFKVTSFVPNGRIELERNDDYWGGAAPSSELVIDRASDNTSAVTSLKAGELSALFNIPWPDVESLKSNGGDVASSTSPAGQKWLDLDNTSPPFDDVNARRALSYAIDRQTILDSVYYGNGVVPVTNAPIGPDSPFADPSLEATEFDLDEAKRLFELAGVTEGTQLTYWTPGAGQYPDLTSIGTILQADLEKIGIKLKIESAELNTWAARFFPPGKSYPDLVVGNSSNGPGGSSALAFFRSGHCECNYANPEFDGLLTEADATPDGSFTDAIRIINNDAPTVSILLVPAPIGLAEGVSGIWLDPTGNPRFESAVQE